MIPSNSRSISRRNILRYSASMAALGAFGAAARAQAPSSKSATLKKGDVILFQGDSITDDGRKRDVLEPNDHRGIGRSYAAMISGQLLLAHPEMDLKCYNRGTSGDKVPDLAARWDADAIALKPAVLSIHIGVNDLWHTVAFGSKYKGTIDDYETGYRELIKRSLKEIPGVRIIICEPFDLRNWRELDPYRAVARKLADEMKLTFVPFQSLFAEAAKAAPGEFWLWDGIHPTVAGHAIMADKWREVVGI